MYFDIINLISRENYSGKLYNEIKLWYNINSRQRKYFASIQALLGGVIKNSVQNSFIIAFRSNLLFKTKNAVKSISYMLEKLKLK